MAAFAGCHDVDVLALLGDTPTRDAVLGAIEAGLYGACQRGAALAIAGSFGTFWVFQQLAQPLPIGVFGSFLCLKLMGLSNNVYAQIGLIMLVLIGIVPAKFVLDPASTPYQIQRTYDAAGHLVRQTDAAGAVPRGGGMFAGSPI